MSLLLALLVLGWVARWVVFRLVLDVLLVVAFAVAVCRVMGVHWREKLS